MCLGTFLMSMRIAQSKIIWELSHLSFIARGGWTMRQRQYPPQIFLYKPIEGLVLGRMAGNVVDSSDLKGKHSLKAAVKQP